MPLVKIEMLKGKSPEYKKTLFEEVHRALVEAFKIKDNDRIQRLYELDKESFELPDYKSDNLMLIELTVFQGRSFDAKRALYQKITENLENALGIDNNDIIIVLNEVPLENWGLKGSAASEIDLGFKIDV